MNNIPGLLAIHEPRCNDRCVGGYHFMDNTVEAWLRDAVKSINPGWREVAVAEYAARLLLALDAQGLLVTYKLALSPENWRAGTGIRGY